MPVKKLPAPSLVTTMRLPQDVLDHATQAAEAQGLSRSQYLISLIRQDAKRNGRRNAQTTSKPEAIDVFN